MDATTNGRTLAEIEQDIKNINLALGDVSEVRASFKSFVRLVLEEDKQANYVHTFNERLNNIKRGLNRLSMDGEALKGALTYAQQIANTKTFDWDAIKRAVENEAADEAQRKRSKKHSENAAEPGSIVKANADRALVQLSSIVLEPKKLQQESDTKFITTHIDHWLAHEKPSDINISVTYDQPERQTLVGSSCFVKILVHKALMATLDINYDQSSQTLSIHRYEIRGTKEETQCQDSQYLVFQKLNILADSAFQDMSVMPAKESLQSILNWIASYHNLFSEPCFRCHKRLQFDSSQFKYLPPMVRTWTRRKIDYMEPDHEMPLAYTKTGLAYHMQCFVAATKVGSKTT